MSLLQQFYKAQVDADADKKIKAVAVKAERARQKIAAGHKQLASI